MFLKETQKYHKNTVENMENVNNIARNMTKVILYCSTLHCTINVVLYSTVIHCIFVILYCMLAEG